jgi:signal transduction histidine kinase
MKKTSLILLLSCITALSPIAQGAPKSQIQVSGDMNFPPYEYLNRNGEPDGYNIDILKAVAKVMDLDINVKLTPWNKARRALEQGDIDMLTGMYYSKERDERVDFAQPLIMVNHALFVRKDSPFHSLNDLRNHEILVQKGDIMDDFARHIQLTPHLEALEDPASALRTLASGQYDAALLASMQGRYLANHYDLNNIRSVPLERPPIEYGFAVRQGDADLQSKLNEGLMIIRNNGEFDRIYDKWFGLLNQTTLTDTLRTVMVWIGLPLLAILAATSCWIFTLHKTVRNRTTALTHELHERQLAQQEREEALRHLESHNREMESILYTVSHDLRSPLVNISGFARELEHDCETLRETHPEEPLLKTIFESLDFIKTSATKMDRLLQGLLQISRQGHAPMNLQKLDMNVVTQTVIQQMQYRIDASGAEVTFSALPSCCADDTQINQVFTNLLDNALKYAHPERPPIIQISGRRDERFSVYCVQDNGMGIPTSDQDKVFQLFHRSHPASEQDGEGLGLSVIRRIIARHGGEVWLESEEGQGSMFYIRLPIAPSA